MRESHEKKGFQKRNTRLKKNTKNEWTQMKWQNATHVNNDYISDVREYKARIEKNIIIHQCSLNARNVNRRKTQA